MPISRANIMTDSGLVLMQRLCKHWGHKLDVEKDDKQARVVFDEGTCLMQADEDKLIVALEALDDASLDRLEQVVDEHLARMAGRGTLDIVWEN
ncbi:DUF2218 domain-containing protein [Aidingimonas halophila]|uniref:DUF2218 domain-containing protein n=1 Tax=Aidingimonas halophila TaxID=574349 RepID=A0A1H2YA85_9GAMM|nr:DUF2218 domain-containing protein [Aidingimonas halophila]GHC34681.1 hypothetical protein GCM10008094_29590 [Aidingimonas halophila]SDX01748.1 hypothetical protein SAMN05443545_103402 [Aidingimonas halophila]